MGTEELCKRYLAALNKGSLADVLSLFAPNATVLSPLYGLVDAGNFYRQLFADTNRSVTTLLNIFVPSGNAPSVALHFHYTWTLKSGKVVQFECVDVFELTADRQQFSKLTIIYDTAPLRADFEESHAAV
ncbi:nuclear transport factor 2 family protein [Noviherbaspirillum denitrificans]|uniref:SnoaL-like domain-containing protein n=1 Tax=Noviherbaspirillum denitrificans TaxID=1968433 RepID=A0A254T6G9_9BURK|nr:nuclear transport factor 2 family protein [Noviherbaspirillum denitrificans]OWW18240.1 hypothetical protein AYR66_02445 [Noviherbaspirillum denitrificans]